MSTNTKFCDEDITLTYNYSGAEKEHVLACKNRPFAVLCSTNLPTPSSSLIDHNLVRELGLKMTNLQCKKIVFLGRKLRLLGKISTTVQCIRNGNVCFNIHFRASVIENLSYAMSLTLIVLLDKRWRCCFPVAAATAKLTINLLLKSRTRPRKLFPATQFSQHQGQGQHHHLQPHQPCQQVHLRVQD